MALTQLSSGAESIIYLDKNKGIVHKKRIEKPYRIAEIDMPLRISRTRKESKVINTLHKLDITVPQLIKQSEFDIEMEYIEGTQLKKILDKRPELSMSIGKNLAVMHDSGIIHGDLTTSNMILGDYGNGEKLYFIDFGLSFFSKKIEDKAVDIHLFKQALESKHFRASDAAYRYFLQGYNPKDKKEIVQRLHVVEQRGRYKVKT